MPPKTVFTKEDVVSAAFEVVQQKGMKALTAREVARRLKSSTAPVYSNFESMKLLEREVMKKSRDLLLDYMTRPYTEIVFLNMGIGYAYFAREQCALFRALYLEDSGYKEIIDELEGSMRVQMAKDPRFTSLDDQDRFSLLDKMWIFTHGMATMICVGLSEDQSDEYIIKTLKDVGSAVIGATLMRQNPNRRNS
jgi:AcrR family transcriptional regulator